LSELLEDGPPPGRTHVIDDESAPAEFAARRKPCVVFSNSDRFAFVGFFGQMKFELLT
jgi:hypothetical protein